MRIAILLLVTLTTMAAAFDTKIDAKFDAKKKKKDGDRLLRGTNLAGMFKADVALPAVLTKGRSRSQELDCSLLPDGDVECRNFPTTNMTTTFTDCPTTDSFALLDCGQCTLESGSSECNSCTVCPATESIAWQCDNLASVPSDLRGYECVSCDGTPGCTDPNPSPNPGPDDRTDGQPTGLSCQFEYGTNDQPTGLTCDFVYDGSDPNPPTPDECTDMTGWADSDGDGCDDYESNPSWCDIADRYANANGIDASQACCVCGGGST